MGVSKLHAAACRALERRSATQCWHEITREVSRATPLCVKLQIWSLTLLHPVLVTQGHCPWVNRPVPLSSGQQLPPLCAATSSRREPRRVTDPFHPSCRSSLQHPSIEDLRHPSKKGRSNCLGEARRPKTPNAPTQPRRHAKGKPRVRARGTPTPLSAAELTPRRPPTRFPR